MTRSGNELDFSLELSDFIKLRLIFEAYFFSLRNIFSNQSN